jgi:gliding motility-associated-like protein
LRYLLFLFIFFISLVSAKLNAQCSTETPTFNVDLSSNPDMTWISPDTSRAGNCCGSSAPDRCVQFIVTLHPQAQGIIFDIYDGAIPPGALFYQVGCNPPTPVGEPLCLSGAGPHSITFCKPGNNENQYSIQSISAPGVGPPIVVNDGCNGSIYAFAYQPSSIVWTSINPGASGAYDHYLDCTNGCDSVNVSAEAGFPPFVDYQVCGIPLGGCDSLPVCDTTRVTFNSTLTATITPINPTVCFGTAGTTITTNGGGGTPPYTYLWSTGNATSSIFVNVGTYWVMLGDSSGCPPTYDTVVVTSFANPITAIAGDDQTVCADHLPIALSGSVIAASGGYWSGGNGTYSPNDSTLTTSYTPTPTEITNGNLQLFLTTTGNGTCPPDTDTVGITLVKFEAFITTTPITVSCFGGNDGSGIISFSGGVPPFTTTWNTAPVQVGDTATGLIAGTYMATLLDGNGCDTTVSVVIPEQPLLVAVISDSLNILCTGGNTGSATVSASGGTGVYSYLWDVNAGNQTESTAVGLVAGTYTGVVTDNNGCQESVSVALTEPVSAISLTVTTTDVSCFGFNNGTATATPSGGTPPYTYLWTPTDQTTSTATNLPQGVYSILVMDTNDCILQPGILINEPLPLSSAATFTEVSCFGGNNGTATVTTSGGTPPYTYLWDANAGNQATSTASGLIAGSYSVVITDTNGCKDTAAVMVSEPLTPISLSTTTTPVNCFGGNDGTATVSPSGGTSPYSIQWDAGTGNQTALTATNLIAGNYTVIVTDTNGCMDTAVVMLSEPLNPISLSTTTTPVSCFGGNDGAATVTATGGTSPYTYLWDANAGNQTESTAIGLIADTYTVVVTDTNGCLDSVSVTVIEPVAVISLTVTTTDVTCFGLNNGTATATPSGGTPPYTYLWTPTNQTTSTATNLPQGVYSVLVMDTYDCILQPGILINEPLPISSAATFTEVSCFGGNNGTATVTVAGGTLPYTYLWDSNAANQTTSTASGLIAGSYSVVITDTNGCKDTAAVMVNQPLSPINLSTTTTSVNCFGGNDGTATLITSGGTSPYSIQWDANAGNQTALTATDLIAGDYTVIITDTNGCIDSVTITIAQSLLPLSSSTSFTAVTCFGGNDGAATVIATGGTSPYFYAWDVNAGNQTTRTATGLIAGSYMVIITDTNGCLDTASSTVTQPNLITIVASPTDTICIGENTTIGATVDGGNGGYIYNWSHGLPDSSSNDVTPLVTTTYLISIVDTFGCTGNMDSVTVYVLSLFSDSIQAISAGDICVGESTQVSGTYSAGFGTYTFSWNQGLGNGLGPFNVSPATTTTYIFTATDQCVNSVSDSIVVNVFPLPIINLPSIVAEGCAPLLVNFMDTINDSTSITYLWNFDDGSVSTFATVNHLYPLPGTYKVTLTVTSNGGCIATSSGNHVVVVNPSPIANSTASPFVTDTQNPTINFTDLSTGAIAVFWNFGDGDTSMVNNPSHTYQDTGTYTVTITVTNQFGCTDTYQITVRIDPFYTFDIPNAFTPKPGGGNGGQYDPNSLLNNVFFPTTEFVKEFEMYIFNRWGELIFVSNDIRIGWDGYYRGVMAQQDVYVWKINITYIDNQYLSKVGDLTLMR